MKKRSVLYALLASCLAVLLITVPDLWARRQSVFDQLDLLADIRHEIVSGYVETPDENKMIEHAVRAMVESLDDPYTIYLSPDELEPFDKQIRGSFSGIGAEVDIDEKEKRLRIISPLEESPAWKAGVMAGDIVLEINGQTTEGLTVNDAVGKLTGPEGSVVTVKVRHVSGEMATFEIKRGRISVQTVKGIRRDAEAHWDWMLEPGQGIGYIRVSQFTDSTAANVRAALDKLIAQKAKGIILDLRFNPGGLLESAVEVSDMFLDEGKRIVSVKGRTVPESIDWSTKEGTIPPVPMVVLANEASASAAEIVTGALSDNDRAKFIGTRTFGKGSVQQVKMLENGRGAIKITNAYYYLPNGRNIHRREGKDVWGVDPQDGFYVPMTPEQVRDMLKVRRESDVLKAAGPGAGPAATITADFVEKELKDLQLAAGIRALEGKLQTGEWPKVGQSNATALARETKKQNLERQRDFLAERLEDVKKELNKLDSGVAGDGTTQPATAPGSAEAATQPVDKQHDIVVPAPETVPPAKDMPPEQKPVPATAPATAPAAETEPSK